MLSGHEDTVANIGIVSTIVLLLVGVLWWTSLVRATSDNPEYAECAHWCSLLKSVKECVGEQSVAQLRANNIITFPGSPGPDADVHLSYRGVDVRFQEVAHRFQVSYTTPGRFPGGVMEWRHGEIYFWRHGVETQIRIEKEEDVATLADFRAWLLALRNQHIASVKASP